METSIIKKATRNHNQLDSSRDQAYYLSRYEKEFDTIIRQRIRTMSEEDLVRTCIEGEKILRYGASVGIPQGNVHFVQESEMKQAYERNLSRLSLLKTAIRTFRNLTLNLSEMMYGAVKGNISDMFHAPIVKKKLEHNWGLNLSTIDASFEYTFNGLIPLGAQELTRYAPNFNKAK